MPAGGGQKTWRDAKPRWRRIREEGEAGEGCRRWCWGQETLKTMEILRLVSPFAKLYFYLSIYLPIYVYLRYPMLFCVSLPTYLARHLSL